MPWSRELVHVGDPASNLKAVSPCSLVVLFLVLALFVCSLRLNLVLTREIIPNCSHINKLHEWWRKKCCLSRSSDNPGGSWVSQLSSVLIGNIPAPTSKYLSHSMGFRMFAENSDEHLIEALYHAITLGMVGGCFQLLGSQKAAQVLH